MRCPYCSHDNIPGDDLCAGCGADLAGLDLPEADPGFIGKLMTDRLRDMPRSAPLEASAATTAGDAIRRMRAARQGCVLIVEGGALLGIFTERDVLARVIRPGLDPDSTPLAAVMSRDPVTLSPSDPPAFAIHRMVAQGLRHLPIVDGTRPVGVVSARNVLGYIHYEVIGAGAAAAR